jgi:hypothetical protein
LLDILIKQLPAPHRLNVLRGQRPDSLVAVWVRLGGVDIAALVAMLKPADLTVVHMHDTTAGCEVLLLVRQLNVGSGNRSTETLDDLRKLLHQLR